MRRILVGLRRVIDHSVRIHVNADGSGVLTDGVKMSVNPFCEIALEEAIRIRERGEADEVLAVLVGEASAEPQLRTALAMGADRALRVDAAADAAAFDIAALLHAIALREQPMLVLLGKQAIDTDNGQTGQLLAALWQRPQATFASSIALDGNSATVEREIDQGIETLALDLPAVITADLRLNEPRFVKLPQMLKAKKQPIELLSQTDLGVALSRQFRQTKLSEPAPRPSGHKVDSVRRLLDELKARGLPG